MDKDSAFYDWAHNYKTVIALNGGTSVTLNEAISKLNELGIPNAPFIEPDLYNQITSVAFLVDQRVWDREKYPDFSAPDQELVNGKWLPENWDAEYQEWVESVGGETNVFLRQWLPKFRLA